MRGTNYDGARKTPTYPCKFALLFLQFANILSFLPFADFWNKRLSGIMAPIRSIPIIMTRMPRQTRPAIFQILLLCSMVLLLAGCRQEETPQKQPRPTPPVAPRVPGCIQCHPVHLDTEHARPCTECHGGNNESADQEEAHSGLISAPAHPDRMAETCGPCHRPQTDQVQGSLHFTLRREANAVRRAFGAEEDLASFTEIPIHQQLATPLDLADDLLRRRCLRCHVFSQGDAYPETIRGAGCAACHLSYDKGELLDHGFIKSPPDSQCLHCHYGNVVGADYHGRFEHDFNWEYRTPYRTDDEYPRPYGIEYHQLAPDIHQQKGMACIDCHSGAELMNPQAAKITCEKCHAWQPGTPLPLDNTSREKDGLVLTTRLSGQKLAIPPLRHPAHGAYKDKAACTVCHAQWTFNDQATHLLRQDHIDFAPWSLLSIQGSFEVEDQIDISEHEVPFMRDKVSTTPYLGLWFKGYDLRRWEIPLIGSRQDGRLAVFRPILDLHLSMVNQDEEVVFDRATINDPANRFQPYTPHTIGKAGAFFMERLRPNLPSEAHQ